MFSEWKGLGRQERSVTYLLYNVEMVLLDQKYPQSGRKTSKIRLTSIKVHSHPQGHRGVDILSWEVNKNDLIIEEKPLNISSFSSDIFVTMTAAHPSTWLITGASSGLGKSLALEALKVGHKVIGATRNVHTAAESCPEFATNGGVWFELDPSREGARERVAQCAKDHDIDVLVNNAAYAFIGGVEDTR